MSSYCAISPTSSPPFQLHTEFGEERFGSLEVVDDDENVVHPLKRHIAGA
jgi:hypothetical protein